MFKTIKSILTLKKELKENLSNDAIDGVLEVAKTSIINQINKNISGEEKKKAVDDCVINLIKGTIRTDNKIILELAKILCNYVPLITQWMFDLLQAKIDGLTKGAE